MASEYTLGHSEVQGFGPNAVTVVANAPVGDKILVFFGGDVFANVNVTDSKGNTYTLIGSEVDDGVGDAYERRLRIYYADVAAGKNLVSGTDTITVTVDSNFAQYLVSAVGLSGYAAGTAGLTNTNISNNTGVATWTSGSVDTTSLGANAVVFGAQVNTDNTGSTGTASTPTGGFTELSDAAAGGGGIAHAMSVQKKVIAAPGATNPGGSFDLGAGYFAAMTVAFAVATVPPSGPPAQVGQYVTTRIGRGRW